MRINYSYQQQINYSKTPLSSRISTNLALVSFRSYENLAPKYSTVNYFNKARTRITSLSRNILYKILSWEKFKLNKALNKMRDFSIKEYKNLSSEELIALRRQYTKIAEINKACIYGEDAEAYFSKNFKTKMTELDLAHERAVDLIKSSLESKFGKDKYKVIIVGRSLSSIGKCLGYRIGEENVINIPLSEAHKFLEQKKIEEAKKNGEMLALANFFNKNGWTKESLDKSNKKIILLDYCYTGDSLKGAKKLFENTYLFKDKELNALDVEYCIPDYTFAKYLDGMLCESMFKKLALITACYDLRDISQCIMKPEKLTKKTKLMLFKLLDTQMKKINLYQ